jgi:hypothetical protein
VRGFQNATYTAGPAFVFDFPSFEKAMRQFAIISPVAQRALSRPIEKEDDLRFFGDTVLRLKQNLNGKPGKRNSEVEALDIVQMSPLWTHPFPKGAPEFGEAPETERIVFAWREDMSRDASLLAHWPKENPNETDKFFQIVNARDGKNAGGVFFRDREIFVYPRVLERSR